MLQIEKPILYFLLLVLRILLNLSLDVNYKQGGFFETLVKKNFKFALSRRDNIVVLNLTLMLLPAKIDFILEK